MNLHYDAFPELAATILDWWETGALAVCIVGLFINFFFTMHKGRSYRAAFVTLLVTLITLLYVDVITPATKYVQADDMIRPIMYSAWAYTVWTRAWIYLDYFVQLKGQYENTIEKVLSLENTVIPWKEVAQFGAEMERWQNWVTRTIAACFAVGLLYSNVDRIEALQLVSIKSNQVSAQVEKKNQQDIQKASNRADSLYLERIVAERIAAEKNMQHLEAIGKKTDRNGALSIQNRKITLQKLYDLERLLRAKQEAVNPIESKSSVDWQLSPDRVKNYSKYRDRNQDDAHNWYYDQDTTLYATKVRQ